MELRHSTKIISLWIALQECGESDDWIRRWFAHWLKNVPDMSTSEHAGDCTNQSFSCSKCAIDAAEMELDALKSFDADLYDAFEATAKRHAVPAEGES